MSDPSTAADAWDPHDPVSDVHPETVVLLEGSSFCLCGPTGDIGPDPVQGLFVRDTRVLSRWELTVNGARPRRLGAEVPEPFMGTFLSVAPVAGGAGELVVTRRRWVGTGLREQITVRNYRPEPTQCTLSISYAADFADLFEVKNGRVPKRESRSSEEKGSRIIQTSWHGQLRGVVVEAPGAEDADGRFTFHGVIGGQSTWTVGLGVRVRVNASELPGVDGHDPEAESARRLREWRTTVPHVRGSSVLSGVLRQSRQDLGSLRIDDPEHPDRLVIAAGAPWFMALFGRDSLLTSLMALPLDPKLALGTLQTLARHQGRTVNPRTEEEPGRILHELRFGMDAALALGGENAYYGTADATPLFVVLLDELRRWGVDAADINELLPNADRALEWMQTSGDRDGDGFIEYQRATEQGLINQGWKDSWDGINHPDGRVATGPIALCEVQGYAYAAYLGRARIAAWSGDPATRDTWQERARSLKAAFNERFWVSERGLFAIALDGAKEPVAACASNMGHCLAMGIVDEDKAGAVVERLMSKEMFSGWGVRTLATDMGAYNPTSYHNGSVWPHDNAIIAAGLLRYGYVEAAQRVATAIVEAAEQFGRRLPELFCGFARTEFHRPIPYPTSCSPQAWAAAAPIHLVRTLLGFEPDLPDGAVSITPRLPHAWGDVEIDNVRLGTGRVRISARGDQFELSGDVPPGLRIVRDAARPDARAGRDGSG